MAHSCGIDHCGNLAIINIQPRSQSFIDQLPSSWVVLRLANSPVLRLVNMDFGVAIGLSVPIGFRTSTQHQ